MTTIERATRYGHLYRVVLTCGHAFEIAKTEFARRQLYIGKRVPCSACAQAQVQRTITGLSSEALTENDQ